MAADILLQQQYSDSERMPSNGAPSSSLKAGFFLHHIEHPHMARLSMKHKIVKFFRYVDDILIIFGPNHSSTQTILAEFNTLHQNLQFAAEMEENKTINYLDIIIHRTPSNWKTAIYRKPTFTDTIIPYTSNHPLQHKYAAVKFFYNRLNTYNLQPEEYQQEENTIQNILYNNSFPRQPHRPHQPKPQKQRQTTHTHQHRSRPHLLTLGKKPHTLPTYSDAPTLILLSTQTKPSTTGYHPYTT